MRCWPALPLLLLAASLSTSLSAQRTRPYFHGSLGFAGGRFGFETDDGLQDDTTDAGLFQLEFEATTKRGIGGGIRYEGLWSDDDLFVANGFTPSEARNGTAYLHFTYRQEAHRFAVPIRFGLLVNGLVLEDIPTGIESTYASIGPYFEIEPEITLVHARAFRWKLYAQLGVGAAVTAIDIEDDFRDYESSTGFAGIEAGTRFQAGPAEVSIAFVGRYQSMDDSDVESGQFVAGYDGRFQGLLISAGVSF